MGSEESRSQSQAACSSEMEDELRPEFDLTKLLKGGARGQYADRYRAGTNVVVLAPDVAQAFPTEEAVECCPALGHAPGAESRGH